MQQNLGSTDKTLRVLAAIIIGAFYWTYTIRGTLAIVAGAVAFVLVVTAIVGFCPAYRVLGLSTADRGTA